MAISQGLTVSFTAASIGVGLGLRLSSFSGNDSRVKNESIIISLSAQVKYPDYGHSRSGSGLPTAWLKDRRQGRRECASQTVLELPQYHVMFMITRISRLEFHCFIVMTQTTIGIRAALTRGR